MSTTQQAEDDSIERLIDEMRSLLTAIATSLDEDNDLRQRIEEVI